MFLDSDFWDVFFYSGSVLDSGTCFVPTRHRSALRMWISRLEKEGRFLTEHRLPGFSIVSEIQINVLGSKRVSQVSVSTLCQIGKKIPYPDFKITDPDFPLKSVLLGHHF